MVKGLSEDEAVRRLKRWYVAGLHATAWDVITARSQHLKLGGRLLRNFGDTYLGWGGTTGIELDLLIREAD